MEDYESYKVPELKELLKSKGLPVTGNKKVLIERLKDQKIKENKEAGMIQLFLKNMMGMYKTIWIEYTATVKELRQKASEAFYSPPSKIVLRRCIRGETPQLGDEMKQSMFGSPEVWRIMNDEECLCALGIYTESTISVFIRF